MLVFVNDFCYFIFNIVFVNKRYVTGSNLRENISEYGLEDSDFNNTQKVTVADFGYPV